MNPTHLPPLQSIRSFEATARHLSFSQAANELCVTQSAISHQVKQLELFLGLKLLNRQKKRITLTQEGDTFYRVATDCIQRLASVTNHLVKQESVVVKIMAQSSIALEWLSPKLAHFKQLHPDIEIMMNMDVHAGNFKAEEFDIIIGTWPTPEGFVTRKLRNERWYPVCSPALYRRLAKNAPSELLGYPLYSSEQGEDWQLWMQQHQLRSPADLTMQHFNLAILAVKAAIAGEGIALSCGFMVDELIKQKLLKALPEMYYELPWGHYHVHYRSDSFFSEKITSFVEWLRKTVRESGSAIDVK